jgi:hypothetical protein
MIDERLRRADPAADWRVDPGSAPARAMLTAILATPRDEPPRPRLRPRRLAVAGAVGATAVAAAVMWTGGGPNEAYAVDAQPDGSVKLTVRWNELDDVDRLAATLRRAGIPTEVTSEAPDRYCASPPERDRASYALNEFHPGAEQPASTEGYVMRPKEFPAGSVLVLATFDDTAHKLSVMMFYLAPADDVSCALSGQLGRMEYYGPGPGPTAFFFTGPSEGP